MTDLLGKQFEIVIEKIQLEMLFGGFVRLIIRGTRVAGAKGVEIQQGEIFADQDRRLELAFNEENQ